MNQPDFEPDGGSGALRRGLRIMLALKQAGPQGMKVAEIATDTGLPRPTVYRLLEVLAQERFVKSIPQGRRYALVWSDRPARESDRWQALARQLAPAMRRIAAVTGNSVFLVRRADTDALCLHREFGDYPIQVHAIAVGGRQPLGVGAAGLALLSAYPDEQVDELLAGSSPRLARYGGMTVRTMRQLVQSTRVRGYSVVANYAVRGILGIGVPLYERNGLPVAAVSVSSTLERMPASQHGEVASLLRGEVGRSAVAP